MMGETISTMAEIIYEREEPDPRTNLVLSLKHCEQNTMSLTKTDGATNLGSPCSPHHVITSPSDNVTSQYTVNHVTGPCSDNPVANFSDSHAFSNRKRNMEAESEGNYITKIARQSDSFSFQRRSELIKEPLEFHKFVDQKLNTNNAMFNERHGEDGRVFNEVMHREGSRGNDVSCGVHNGTGKYHHMSTGSNNCNCGCDSDSYLKKMLETSNMLAPCVGCDTRNGNQSFKQGESFPENERNIRSVRENILQEPRGKLDDKMESTTDNLTILDKADYMRKQADKIAMMHQPVNSVNQGQGAVRISHYHIDSINITDVNNTARRPCPEHHGTSRGTQMTSPEHHSVTEHTSAVGRVSEKGPPPLIHIEETKPNQCQSDVKCTCYVSNQHNIQKPQNAATVSGRPEQPLDLTHVDEPLDLSLKATNLKVPPRRASDGEIIQMVPEYTPPRRVSVGAVPRSSPPTNNWPICNSAPVQEIPDQPHSRPYPAHHCSGHCCSVPTCPSQQPLKQPPNHFVTYHDQPMPQRPMYHGHRQHVPHVPAPCHLHGVGRGRMDGGMIPPDGPIPPQRPAVPGHLHAAYLMLAPKPFKRGRGRPRTPKSLKALEDALKVRYDLEDILCLVCNICSAYFTRVATLYSHFSKAHEVPLCMDYITVRTITEVRGAMHHHGLNNADVQMMFAQLQVFNAGNLKGSPPVNQVPEKMSHSQPGLGPNFNNNTPSNGYNPIPKTVEYVNRACSPRGGTPINSIVNSPHNSRPASVIIPNIPTRSESTPESTNTQNEADAEPSKTQTEATENKIDVTVEGDSTQNSMLDYIGDIISHHCGEAKERGDKDGTSSPHSIKGHNSTATHEERHSTDTNNGFDQCSPSVEIKDSSNMTEIRNEINNKNDDSVQNSYSHDAGQTSDLDMRNDIDEASREVSRASGTVLSLECVQDYSNSKDSFNMNSDMGQLFGGRLCIDLDVR